MWPVARGCSCSEVVEPCQDAPGRVKVNNQIHAKGPLEGDVLLIAMKQSDGSFVYGRPRKRIG